MRRGTFAAILAAGTALPLLAAAAAMTRPAVRAWVGDFVAPLPPPAPEAKALRTVEALPSQLTITGAESPELHAFGAGDAGPPTDRGPRTVLFPREVPPVHDGYVRPSGLRRSELASRDDAQVESAIQYLATDAHGRGALLAAVQRSGQHRDQVASILRAWKLPVELSAIIFVESAYVPTATSLDGASGLWSLPLDVARAYGLAILPKYDERRSVSLATEAAAHYLADLHERFDSWELAILAFGQGYVRTMDAVQKHSSLEYWDLVSELPADGTTYVAEVICVATMLGNPDRFGLDVVKADDPIVTSDLEVPAEATFSLVARAAGTSAGRLHELNPEFLGDTVPSTGFAMAMHLPSAGLARAKELLMPLMYSTSSGGGGGAAFDWGRSPPSLRDGGPVSSDAGSSPVASPTIVSRGRGGRMYYRVQDGDTLESLGRRYNTPRETIASDNALDPTAGLKAGQLLLLRPGGNGAATPSIP
jgi:hypothetical protein